MKIRTSFVTNSSSSSYIIAYKGLSEIDEETLIKYPFLKNYGKLIEKILFTAGDYNDTTAGRVYKTKEEWDNYFIYCYGWKDINIVDKILEADPYLKDTYNNVIEHLEKGFNILCKSVDYCDTYCVNMFNELAEDKDNFVILEDE